MTISSNYSISYLVCPIKDCGTQGICVETDGLVPKVGIRPIYYVCLCQQGYISAGSCDGKIALNKQDLNFEFSFLLLDLLGAGLTAVAGRCGPNGKTYPSRNPNNPIGCWCNNGTHIEEIEDDGPAQYCV